MSDEPKSCNLWTHKPVCRLWATIQGAAVSISWAVPHHELNPGFARVLAESCPHFQTEPESEK